MRLRDWPTVLGLMVFALTAIGCATFLLATRMIDLYAVAGAVLVLAAGQLIATVAAALRFARLEDHLERHERLLQKTEAAQAETLTRFRTMDDRLARAGSGRFDEIAAELRELRDAIRNLLRPQPAPRAEAPPASAPPPPAEPAAPAFGERLDLLLEPVVELASGTTLHYRAQLNLAGGDGKPVAHADLMAKADQGGMRPPLDVHLLKQVAPVLRRLQVRQPNLRVFLPLGAATLASHPDMQRLGEILTQESDVAGGIVFEITQQTLAGLDPVGIESLAELGRMGATMALSEVNVAGADLAALRHLGVRYLGLDAVTLDAGFGMSPAWRDFAQYARAMKFQIVATGVATTQQASAANQLARFGCGPFFAPPRKVRTDAGTAASQRGAQAA